MKEIYALYKWLEGGGIEVIIYHETEGEAMRDWDLMEKVYEESNREFEGGIAAINISDEEKTVNALNHALVRDLPD